MADDESRLPQNRAEPEEKIMLAEIGAVAGAVVVLAGLGCLMYFRYLKH